MNARKLFRGLPRLCLLPVFLVVSSVAMAETSTLWLDELDLGGMRQGFGKPQARQSVMGRTLTVAGHAFAKGIGTHAASGLVLDVRGKASRLEALVGVDDEPKTYPGSVEFLVLGDGKVLWKSGLMKGGDSAKPVNIDLNGVKSLELRVTDGGDGNDSDQADWLNARLVVTAPLERLYPPERRSPEAWNRLSEEQVRRGYGMEEVAAGVWRIRLGQPEKLVPTRFQEHAPRLKEIAALEPCKRLPIKVSTIGFKASGRGSALELPLEPGEQLYGLGMNLKVFQLMNGKKTIRVSDDQGTILGDSHAPVPFYVSTRGYGVYVDTARYASFYFGNLDAVRDAPVAARPTTGEKSATSTEELVPPARTGSEVRRRGRSLGKGRGCVRLCRSRHATCRTAVQPVFRGRLPSADVGLGRVVSRLDRAWAEGSPEFPARVPRAAHSLRRVRAGARMALARLLLFLRLEPAISRPGTVASRDASNKATS